MWDFYPYQGQAFHGFLSGGGLKDNKLEGFRPKLTRPVRLCEYDKICAKSQITLRARRWRDGTSIVDGGEIKLR